MKHLIQTSGKKVIVMLMISLLLTGCSLMPSTMGNTAKEALDGSGTVTISREEYERLLKYAEIEEILQIVQAGYYEETDQEAMMEGAAQGLLYALEDPYTFYYTPEQYGEKWADDKGEYQGIGIMLMASYETYLCTITRVFENGPAYEVGVRRGDILTKVEDLEVTAYSLSEAVEIMRGEVGQTVNIQVLRGDEFLDFTVARAEVHVDRVQSCMLEETIGYIALYEFSTGCSLTFRERFDDLMSKGAKGIIIDLRDNPGGFIDEATKIADIFLPEGVAIYLENRNGDREYYRTKAGAEDIPLIVIMNENSASGSEALAGALQDHQRATIVGTQSFGKGIAQHILGVGVRGAGIQFTSAQYFTPNGNKVHKVGITPDVEAQMPEGDVELYQLGDLRDAQLKKAYEVALELAAK